MSVLMYIETEKKLRVFKKLAGLLVCLTLSLSSLAQDIHFSMFNSCPLILNPANAGNFIGDWRLALNFRNQWSTISSFNTAALSFDKQIYLFNQDMGAGLVFINDQAGAKSLTSNKLYATIRYGREINKNFFNLGVQLGFVYQAIGADQLFPDQYDRESGEYNPELPSTISGAGEKHYYLDLNIGLLWKRSIRIFEPEVGLSFSHLNSPNQSFFGGTYKLPVRSTIHLGVKTKLSDDFYVLPSILYTNQKAATETMLGTNLGMNLFGNKSSVKEIFAGLYLRNGVFDKADAISILAGATIRRIEIALCYDITVSKLNTATNNKSAFEISIIYKSISTVLNSYSIPCERF